MVSVTVTAQPGSAVPSASDVLAAVKSVPELGGGEVSFLIAVNRVETDYVSESADFTVPVP